MIWLYAGLGVSISLSIALGIAVFTEIKRTYQQKQIFSDGLLNSWYLMWALHHVPVIVASWFSIWHLPIEKALARTGGWTLFAIGVVLLPMGMIEFRSLRRSTGQDISELITTGIYRWSRNPQFVGWALILLGVSIVGRSGLALALTLVFMIVLHLYTIRLAEPYLGDLYGEDYHRYLSTTPRYIGIPQTRADRVAGSR